MSANTTQVSDEIKQRLEKYFASKGFENEKIKANKAKTPAKIKKSRISEKINKHFEKNN